MNTGVGRHIAMVITRGDVIGGAQTHVAELTVGLIARGHRVTVFAGGKGAFSDRLADAGADIVDLPGLSREIAPLRDANTILRFGRMLKRHAPDLVACHSSKAGIVGRAAARLAGIPSVFTAHGWAFAEGIPQPRRWFYRLIERRMSRFCRAVITVSEADARLAVEGGVARHAPLIAIHNGLPDHPPAPFPAHETEPRLLMVARLVEQKNHAALLRALARVTDRAFHLDLVGEGPLGDELKALAKSLNLQDRVTFHGYRSDVPAFIERASLVVLLSHWEGLPISLIEAMRLGRPLVASDVGGVRELFGASPIGWLVPSDDPASLASLLRDALEDHEQLKRLGANARKRFEEAFSVDVMVDRTLQVYEGAIAGRVPDA